MAGNATFESSELVFCGTYLNGQRGVRSAAVGPNLDRSGNFREGSESRMFGSGFAMPRGGSSAFVGSDDFRTLSECMSLEPIVISDQIMWYDELRRVMGISVGSTAEENSFRAAAAHVKPFAPVAVMKDLKRFRLSVEDACVKARVRATKMDERLRQLDRYCQAVTSMKHKRSELVSNDRAGALNLKMGTQIYNMNQRVEDRPKNLLLNKRVRTSVAESRSECQSNGLQRHPVAMAKDGNLLEDNNGESDLVEKIRRLAAGGEGWDKKVKRKRSVGTVFTRPIDNDGVPKRAVQNKVVGERGSQPLDVHINSSVTKSKPSRTARGGSMVAPSSSPMTQWTGQRPQKMARVRRPNLVSPVSNQDEKLLSFEGSSPTDIGARISFNGTNGSPISKNPTNLPQKLILKPNNIKSSPRLSESEESLGGERRLMYKEMGNNEADAIAKNGRLVNAATPKPFQSQKTGCKKSGSKSGHRLKKLSERKGFSHRPLQNGSSPDCTGASDDDREELLAAANHARVASYLACSSAFWKKMDPVFSSVSSEHKSFLSQQVNLLHVDPKSVAASSSELKTHMQHQETKSFSGRHDLEKTSKDFIPLYQRVLSSLIIEDDINTIEERDARNTQVQNGFGYSTYDTYRLNDFKSFPSNGGINSFTSSRMNDIHENANSEVELLAGISKGFLNMPPNFQTEGIDSFSLGSRYGEMSLDDKILLELQSIGLCPDTLPGLDDMEDEAILTEVDNLKTRLHEQEVKKKAYLEKICKGVESNSGVRDLEILAMDRLVEMAYRKLLATRRSSRSGIQKVPKQVALAFGKRTLARCHKFQNTGTSCFNEPTFQDILSAPIENKTDPELLSDEAFAINGPISNRGKKKELLLDDIAIRSPSTVSGGPKGKRSERDPSKSRKPKPRQKTGQLPPTGNTSVSRPTGPTTQATRRDIRFASSTNLMVDDLEGLDELGVGGPQDLNSFLNFDDQVPDEDFAGGLDIPMDDLTELF